MQELEKLICRIYEDNILGKLPDERYTILDGQYSKEQKNLSAEIADMEAELSGYEEGRCRGTAPAPTTMPWLPVPATTW